MKVRVYIWILLILVCASAVHASDETKVANGWYHYQEKFTSGDDEYSFMLADATTSDMNEGKILLKKNNERFVINIHECEETVHHKYCFHNKTFEGSKVDIDGKGQLQPSVQLEFIEYTYSNELEVSRTFEKTSFNIKETSDVTITVKNPTDQVIKNIRLFEEVPEGFVIEYKSVGFTRLDNTLINTFTLYPGSEWTGEYRVRAEGYVRDKYQTEIKYDTINESDQIAKSKEVELVVSTPFTVTYSLPESVGRDDKIDFILNIKNNEDKAITLTDISIDIPLGIIPTSYTGLYKGKYNQFSASEVRIPSGETKSFTVKNNAPLVGMFDIDYEGSINTKGFDISFSNKTSFSVTTEGLNCYFHFEDASIISGQYIEYDAYAKNNDDNDQYYNITGTISSELGEDYSFSVPVLLQGDEKKILYDRVITPYSPVDKTYNFSIEATYKTEYNQEFSCKTWSTVLAKKGDSIITFNSSINRTNVTLGKSAIVSTAITNLLDSELPAFTITDEINGVTTTGITSNTFNQLSPNEYINTYIYTITVPETYEKDTITINTTIVFPTINITQFNSQIIKVLNPYVKPNSTVNTTTNATEPKTTTQPNSTIQPEKKKPIITSPKPKKATKEKEEEKDKNFFTRLFDLLESFFQ